MNINRITYQFIFLLGINFLLPNSLFSQKTDSIVGLKPPIKTELHNFDQNNIESYLEMEAFQYASKAQYDESLWTRMKRWLRDKFMRMLGSDASLFNKIISWAMIIGLVLALAYFMTNTSSNSIFSPNSKRSKIRAEILDEEVDITNIDRAILKAEESGDFRQAIRYRYIQALLKSENKEYISLAKYKTIEDYIDEFSNKNHTSEFKKVSKIFEHYWYGDYDIDKTNYEVQLLSFKHFLTQLDQVKNVLAKK